MKKVSHKNEIKLGTIFSSIGLVIATAGSVLFGYFLKTPTQLLSEYNEEISYYDCSYDAELKSPSAKQITDLRTFDYITDVTEVTKVKADVKVSNKNITTYVSVFDDLTNLENTNYSSKRVLEKTDLKENSVFIDYNFSQSHDVKLNDTLSFLNKDCVVTGIYHTDYSSEKGSVVISKKYFDKLTVEPTSIYVKANDETKLATYLKDYKPYGSFLEKTPEQTEEEYQAYVDRFNSADYSLMKVNPKLEKAEITADYNAKNSGATRTLWIFTGVYSALILCFTLGTLFIRFKAKRKYIVDNGNNGLTVTFGFSGNLLAIFALVGGIVACLLMPQFATFVIESEAIFALGLPMVTVSVVSAIIPTIINLVVIRKL